MLRRLKQDYATMFQQPACLPSTSAEIVPEYLQLCVSFLHQGCFATAEAFPLAEVWAPGAAQLRCTPSERNAACAVSRRWKQMRYLQGCQMLSDVRHVEQSVQALASLPEALPQAHGPAPLSGLWHPCAASWKLPPLALFGTLDSLFHLWCPQI